ncbi:MAG: hypothetical protein A4S17_00845 [Proteobacteria bacterium HN_bin10]|jgi:preprotein translocase subunit SecE|nr:MAG: hypothetical protein A4S17_00845 [Proteobacteria bacterium HN_bin10]
MATDQADQDAEPRRRGGGPFRFFGEVRAEARKVTWATMKEVQISTIMVIIFGIVTAIFFFFVDSLLRLAMNFLLNLGL